MKQVKSCKAAGFLFLSVLLAGIAVFFSACDDSTGPETPNTTPVIVLVGDSVMTITEQDHFVDPGATALDAEDGDLTAAIVVNYGTLDTSNAAVGTYPVTYSVQDSEGESASVIRTVIVIEDVVPDTVLITAPLTNPSVFSDTSVTYKIPVSLTIPTGYSVTFGANTRVIMVGNLTVAGALVIEAGARFWIAEGVYIKVTTGSLNINGTAVDTVFFTNYEGGKYWGHDGSDSYYSYAILFEANANATSSITYCVIDSGTTGLNIKKDLLSITNTTVSHSKYAGIYFYKCGPKDAASFSNNAFLANGSASTFYPLVIGADYLNRLSGTGTFTGNLAQAIRVEDATVTLTGTWKKHSVPYVFEGSTVINNTSTGVIITVDSGTVMKFKEEASLKIDAATFIAIGTATSPIVFSNYENGKYWGHEGSDSYYSYSLFFTANANANSMLNYCSVDSGTTGINIRKDGLTVSNTTVSHSKYAGIFFYQCGPLDSASFMNNAFLANGSSSTFYPLVIGADFLNRLSGTGTFTGNLAQAIRVEDATVSITGTWKKHSVPYAFEGATTINNTSSEVIITVDSGAVMKFKEEASLKVDAATFIAVGTATSPIVFSNYENGKYWGHDGSDSYYSYALFFTANANANSVVNYCVIDSGTTGLNVRKDGIAISNTSVSNSVYAGMYFYQCGPKDSTTFVNNSFTGNGSTNLFYPLRIQAPYLDRLSGTSVFTTNTNDAIFVDHATVVTSGSWKKQTVPYVFGGGTIIDNDNGVVISIHPGTALKFLVDATIEVRNATLNAVGTVADSITFGNFVAGQNWGKDSDAGYYSFGLYFSPEANAASTVSFCAFTAATQAININNVAVTVSDCSISNSKYWGLYTKLAGNTNIGTISYSGNGSGEHLHED